MRILVVEDQALIGKALVKGLTEEGFAVDWATCAADASHLTSGADFDAVILDVMLPDGSGLDFLQAFRKLDARTPALMLTARDTLSDKKLGFAAGADDYLTKPFEFEELVARVHALTRRKYQVYGNLLQYKSLTLDLNARTVTASHQSISMTAKEFAILEMFLLQPDKVHSRVKILEYLYADAGEQESNVIEVFINKLRRKLESAGVSGLIETVRGEGYVIRT